MGFSVILTFSELRLSSNLIALDVVVVVQFLSPKRKTTPRIEASIAWLIKMQTAHPG
jgi:hypothetical protein